MKQGGLRSKGVVKQSGPNGPLVSIITVVLNGGRHIEQTINSVLGQTYRNVEYIIIDGGSTDRTVEILNKYNDKIDHWQSTADNGIYFAMNTGISLAKGEIIGILNADDFYFEDAVQHIVDSDKMNGASVYYGDIMHFSGQEGDAIQTRMKPDITRMNEMPSIYHPTCFVKRSVYEKAGDFDTRFKISADYEFLLRCLRMNFKFQYVPELITSFRAGGLSASCYSNIEGYKVMKMHKTGYHRPVIWRAVKCYTKTFLKKILLLKR